ncbi:MAG: glycoside hydrolase 100 family protein [Chitinophagaceae bacterium]
MVSNIANTATKLLHDIAADGYLKASLEQSDNYNRVWSRDTAVGVLAIIASQQKSLFPAIANSLLALQKAANEQGQIPSNLVLNASSEVSKVSFGGPVGRTDASFWWIIATISFLKQQKDETLEKVAIEQVAKIFQLANAWEFNGKHLMYVPMSSNWADEYITNGYVLYDQLLRYWALELAGNYFDNNLWTKKAEQVKFAIKQHFLIEADLAGSLFTGKQIADLQNWNVQHQFIASFTPGEIVNRYDGWSIALLLLLDIPNQKNKQIIIDLIQKTFDQYQCKGIPAFWPFITNAGIDYTRLQFNHHYRFKNEAGHFHNGGMWPVVNGFLILGLMAQQQHDIAEKHFMSLHKLLELNATTYPFAEYFDAIEGNPQGVKNLCYSASGYILGYEAVENNIDIDELFLFYKNSQKKIYHQVLQTAEQLLSNISIANNQLTVITVAGESGCGKTTMSKALCELLHNKGCHVLVLHQDDYFKLPPQKNHQARVASFNHIGTSEVHLDLIDKHLQIIKNKEQTALRIPHMNWKIDEAETIEVDISTIQVVIVEGTYTTLLKGVDTRIFLTANYQQTKKNRLQRNRETVTDFIEKVLEKESVIIQSHAVNADIWIDEHLQIHQNKSL